MEKREPLEIRETEIEMQKVPEEIPEVKLIAAIRRNTVRQDGTILPFLQKVRRESDDLSWNSEEEEQEEEQKARQEEASPKKNGAVEHINREEGRLPLFRVLDSSELE
jgi:hypothetical protein